jgi:hypothetical protein
MTIELALELIEIKLQTVALHYQLGDFNSAEKQSLETLSICRDVLDQIKDKNYSEFHFLQVNEIDRKNFNNLASYLIELQDWILVFYNKRFPGTDQN